MGILNRVLNSTGIDSAKSREIEVSTTWSGTTEKPIEKGLPKQIESVCPECMKIIDATLFEADGKVWIKKRCEEHGEVEDVFYGDVGLYHKSERFWFGDGKGIEDPPIKNATVCPAQCGLCNMHLSHSGLPIMDLTNRCNLTCPVCFANANAAGYLYEPSFEDVSRMLEALVAQRPVSANRVQFSGGEPTARPDFLRIVRRAVELGFDYLQVNTNGIKMAEPAFADAAKEAGVENLYLQFDGLSDEIYSKTRGKSLLDYKLRTIENCRRLKIGVVLVPTMVKGYNDHQVGDIVKFAVKNNDVISGIAFQPVSFVGRYGKSHRLERRYTLADLALDIERQSGYINAMRDWFPLGCTSVLSKLATSMKGAQAFSLTLHPHCSQGTLLYISRDGTVTPVSAFIDIEGFAEQAYALSNEIKPSSFKLLSKAKALHRLSKYFHKEAAPKGMTFETFLVSLDGYQDRASRKVFNGEDLMKKYGFYHIFIAGMHFMDAYNFSVERVKRCVIHYVDPSGHMYPFCAYNGAPIYRKRVENKYKLDAEALRAKVEAEGRPEELEKVAAKMGI